MVYIYRQCIVVWWRTYGCVRTLHSQGLGNKGANLISTGSSLPDEWGEIESLDPALQREG